MIELFARGCNGLVFVVELYLGVWVAVIVFGVVFGFLSRWFVKRILTVEDR